MAQAEQGQLTNPPPAAALSPGISEILKMADAGVSPEVIKTYVESSPMAYQSTEADVIALKQHHVADEVVILLLKRGAQVRVALAQAKNEAAARALALRTRASGGFDPDSYEYFQYYYLQPRAQASMYQRLYPYAYPRFPYAYGQAAGFGPTFSSGLTYPVYPDYPRGWRR
ncbi:MAG: hypothetical protein NTW03_18685 [Verrucomicrobia bacterium]|nr:hypothetical protein [Verrucomicrobiota bacterium]